MEFKDGKKLDEVVCEYPIGHKRRRKEGMPVLVEKFKVNLARRFPPKQQKAILDLCLDAGADSVTDARRRKADLLDARAEGEPSFVASNVLRSAATLERERIS